MTCRVQRGRSPVSGLWLIGDSAWVVRRGGETEGGKSVSWYRYASPPGKIALGDLVKHRTGSLSRAEWKYERPVRNKNWLLPVLMPRLFQALWEKLEGGHDTGRREGSGIHVASQVPSHAHANSTGDPQTARLASSARAFTQTPHDGLAQLIPAPPPLITHNPHTRASVLSPDKQSLSLTLLNSLALAVERQHTADTLRHYPLPSRANPGISTGLPTSNTTRTLYYRDSSCTT